MLNLILKIPLRELRLYRAKGIEMLKKRISGNPTWFKVRNYILSNYNFALKISLLVLKAWMLWNGKAKETD